MRAVTALARRRVECVSDLTIDRWLLGETPGSDEARRLEEHMKECTGCASRIGALRGLYSTQPVPAMKQPPVHLARPPEASPSQTGAVQFLILRDGLLVGSEFFTPGTYVIGSDARADLQLDQVSPLHATIYFRDGKVALKAEGGPVWVSGFKVDSCEVRSIDEVLVGPYVLRARVIRERWSDVHRVEAVTELTVIEPPVTCPHPEPSSLDAAASSPLRGAARRLALPRGEGAARLTAELWWGDARQAVASFVGEVTGRDFPLVDVSDDFVLATPRPDGGFVVHMPGSEITLTLGQTHSIDLGAMRLTWRVDEVLPVLPRAKFESWAVTLLAAAMMTLLFGGFALAPEPEEESFEAKTLHPFVKLIPPPKPVKVAKIEPTSSTTKNDSVKRPIDRPRVSRPSASPPTSDPFASLKRVTDRSIAKILAGMATGKSPGSKSKGLLANLTLPGSGRGGPELGISGDGGPRIGATGLKNSGLMSLGRIGTGKVGGTVERPTSTNVALRGGLTTSIDKDALAKAINAHLSEVSACYERSLIKMGDSGGGKLTLEWTVNTRGAVEGAKVKNSTLKDGGIASCVLSALKSWRFPSARGGSVVVSYPFIFHSSTF